METLHHRAEAIAPGVLALGGWEPADERISWLADPPGGWLPINCYLLVEGDEGLLVDSGVAAHEEVILRQLADLDGELSRMAVFVSRFVEFDSAGNVAPIVAAVSVDRVLAHFPDREHVDGKPHDGIAWLHTGDGVDIPPGLVCEPIDEAADLFVDRARRRAVELHRAPLRLLLSTWTLDRRTGTLFTSDAFGHALLADPATGRIVDDGADTTTIEDVRRGLLGKFGWLAEADPVPTREAVAAFFATHDVHAIAPAYGGILRGREVVDRHVGMVLDVLDRMAAERST